MKRSVLIFSFMLVLASLCSAQQSEVATMKDVSSNPSPGLGVSPAVTPFSLIDLSRIRWSHSYSQVYSERFRWCHERTRISSA